MEHEPILHVVSNRILLRKTYHEPFTVTFPDKSKLVPGCIDGAQDEDTASVLGSTPQYSRVKYTPLMLVKWRMH